MVGKVLEEEIEGLSFSSESDSTFQDPHVAPCHPPYLKEMSEQLAFLGLTSPVFCNILSLT